ncbi:hypothetical protein SPBR_07868 [Sporothrix brasiliensis 5110]|uniref:DUF7143 domain-containing protein n=1 Tax=Sporothrix brasiliensis 5110 TaxID=1398154 RepID=A0A0C2FCP5_9PEZI|nr:uncharacterized protein SPBR_07868 [Sporothrix brasiliensis 5110]KIH88898.1 hypothetical protein SPBR_07868 [Sporothrix brasiliensis 5110]
MRASLVALACVSGCLAAPAPAKRASDLCFVIGNTVLPAETQTAVDALADVTTCSKTTTTIANVPDVTSGNVSFSQINFAKSKSSTLQFALDEFATSSPLADNDLTTFQNQLNTYVATEAGIRSVAGPLAIKVPKFFLEFQVSRIQTAQGNPPTDPGLAVDHLLTKVLTNAAGQSQDLLDQVTALSKVLA